MNILLTGGARSGKSDYAEKLAKELGGEVLFVATAIPFDKEMQERIKKHKSSRPKDWRTLESPMGIGKIIQREIADSKTVIIDCITVLLNNIYLELTNNSEKELSADELLRCVRREMEDIITCMKNTAASYIIVTNEVGLGIVPDNKPARLYRDALGKANQILAQHVDKVCLMVCGIPITVKENRQAPQIQ